MSNFITQENKGLLWGLLSDQNVFNNMPDTEKNNVQKLFESEIRKIYDKADKNSDLLILNKLLIQNFTTELQFYKQEKGFKNQVLNNEYESKKKEFENYMKVNKPDDIKFKIDLDEPLNSSDLDEKLNLIYKQRSELIPEYEKVIINNNELQDYNNNELQDQNNNELQDQNNNELQDQNNNELQYQNNEIDDLNEKINSKNKNKNEKKVEFNESTFIIPPIFEEKEKNNNIILEINNKLDILSGKIDLLIDKINKIESKIL